MIHPVSKKHWSTFLSTKKNKLLNWGVIFRMFYQHDREIHSQTDRSIYIYSVFKHDQIKL